MEQRRREHDDDWFSAVFTAEYDNLRRYVARRTPRSDVDDVVEAVFLALWRRRSEIDRSTPTIAWLIGAARRQIANTHRGERRTRRLTEKLAGALGAHPQIDPGYAIERIGETDEELAKALSRLSPGDVEILTLHTFEELTDNEIAEVLGVRPAAARKRLERARRRLRDELSDDPSRAGRGGVTEPLLPDI